MKCTIVSGIIFGCLSVVYGTVFAANEQGLKYFSAGLYQTIRMFAGALSNLIVLGVRCLVQKGYSKTVKDNFDCSFWSFLWLWIGGTFNLGLPHSVITVSQAYLSSAALQMAQPLASVFGQLFGLCVLKDEPMQKKDWISMAACIIGAVVAEITPFNHPVDGVSGGQVMLGLGLLLAGVAMFGMAPVLLKWKANDFELTVSAFVQTSASTFFCFIYTLLTDGKIEMFAELKAAPWTAYLWPALVGIIAGSAALHGFIYLINSVGTTGANLTAVGQLLVGLIVGIFVLKEWSSYSWWEVAINIIGVLFLVASIVIAFYTPKKPTDANLEKPVNPEVDSAEEKNSIEDQRRKIPEEL